MLRATTANTQKQATLGTTNQNSPGTPWVNAIMAQKKIAGAHIQETAMEAAPRHTLSFRPATKKSSDVRCFVVKRYTAPIITTA
jgi:hypothetical protein